MTFLDLALILTVPIFDGDTVLALEDQADRLRLERMRRDFVATSCWTAIEEDRAGNLLPTCGGCAWTQG